jgi:hypothetical protein
MINLMTVLESAAKAIFHFAKLGKVFIKMTLLKKHNIFVKLTEALQVPILFQNVGGKVGSFFFDYIFKHI